MMLATLEMAIRVALSITWGNMSSGHQWIWDEITYIILIGVHCFRIEALFALLIALLYMLAYPDISVQPKDEVDIARQTNEMRL